MSISIPITTRTPSSIDIMAMNRQFKETSLLSENRILLALLLLQKTGCDLELLVELQVKHLQDLLQKHYTRVQLRDDTYYISISTDGRDEVKECFRLGMGKLYTGKNEDDYIFSLLNDSSRRMTKSNLRRDINAFLMNPAKLRGFASDLVVDDFLKGRHIFVSNGGDTTTMRSITQTIIGRQMEDSILSNENNRP